MLLWEKEDRLTPIRSYEDQRSITAKIFTSFEYTVFKIPLLKYEHSVVEI